MSSVDVDVVCKEVDCIAQKTPGDSKEDSKLENDVANEESMFVDGGWGWAVVVSCFVGSMITDGMLYSFGVLYVEIINKFESSNAVAGWILSIQLFFYLLIGPVTSATTTLLGGRTTLIIGYIMMAIGSSASAFVTNIYLLYLTMGFFLGGGLGMAYQTASVIPNFYFLKKRGLANGIVACGSGVGLFVFPPLTTYFLEEFGFFGTCILLSGLCVQGIVFAALIVSPEKAVQIQQRKMESAENFTGLVERTVNIVWVTASAKSSLSPEWFKAPTSAFSTHPAAFATPMQNALRLADKEEVETSRTGIYEQFRNQLKLSVKASFDIKLFKRAPFVFYLLSRLLFDQCYYIPFAFIPDRALSFGMTAQQSGFLLSVAGIASTVARTPIGLIADRDFAAGKSLFFYSASIIICGAATAVNFGTAFTLQAAYTAILGAAGGCMFCLRCITLVEMLGVENLSTVYGMGNFLSAFGSLGGPPLAGFMLDKTGSYDAVFAFAGTGMFLAGAVLLFIPCIKTYKKQMKLKAKEATTSPVIPIYNIPVAA